jgi:putative ABC transport system permease protein
MARGAVAGSVGAGGGPLAVMDIAAAQDLFGKRRPALAHRRAPQARRRDTRLARSRCSCRPACTAAAPGDAAERVDNLSRAYRVNLTVLALVALVHRRLPGVLGAGAQRGRRAQQFALLGVLGLTARERLQLVLAESALLGVVGSALGIALGTALAALALRCWAATWAAATFRRARPAAVEHGCGAGVRRAGRAGRGRAAGWPARGRAACRWRRRSRAWARRCRAAPPLARLAGMLAAAGLLALLPPIAGVPLAAYVSVGLLLVGGITVLPAGCRRCSTTGSPAGGDRLLPLLAVERARRVRESAAVAVSGVVAALSLAVALTVMVASFRHRSRAGWTCCCRPTSTCAPRWAPRPAATRPSSRPRWCRHRACPAWRAWARNAPCSCCWTPAGRRARARAPARRRPARCRWWAGAAGAAGACGST